MAVLSPISPEGWTQRRLGECADQRTEKTLPDSTDTRPYVALEHLAQGFPKILGWFLASHAVSAKTVFRKGDVLFGKLRPNLRKAAAAPFDGLCSTDILSMFGKDGLETPYLLQLAQWDDLQQHAIATASGTKMPRTSWKQLAEFLVKLPPVAEQRKISAILSSVDDAIEKTKAVIGQVRVLKRGLTQRLLTGDFRAGTPQKSWRLVRLAEVANQRTEKRRPTQWDNRPYVALEHLAQGFPSVLGWFESSDASSAKTIFYKGDVLFGKLRPNLRKAAMAPFEGVCSTDIMPLYCGSDLDGRYLVQLAHCHRLQRHAVATSSGTKMPRTSWKQLGKFTFMLPSLDEQRKIASILSSIDDTTNRNGVVLDNLLLVRRALMSILLIGELRVTPDPETA